MVKILSQLCGFLPDLENFHDNKYFKCEQCDYSAHQNSTLMTHVRIVHDKLERFACKICPFATAVKVNLEYHMIKEHGVDKPYKCNECNYECITKQNIEKHVQSVKKGEREKFFFGARRKGYRVINRNVVTGTPVSEPRVYTGRGTNLV